MDNRSLIERVNVRLAAIVGIVLIVVLSIVIFLANNVIAFINVSGAPKGSSVVLSRISGDETKKVGGAGVVVIPRGADDFEISAGDSVKTLTTIQQPWYGITSKSINLKAPKNADKVAFISDNGLCTSYNPELDKLLRFDCKEPFALIEYKAPADSIWSNEITRELAYVKNQTLPPYMGGVIGIAEDAHRDANEDHSHGVLDVAIKVSTPSGVKLYDAPGDLTLDNLSDVRIYTDTADPDNNKFIVVDRYGMIYLGTPSNDGNNVSYKQVEAPGAYSYKYNQTSCTFHAGDATCYRSRNTVAISGNDSALTKPVVESISFTEGLKSSTEVTNSPTVAGIYTVSDKLYVRESKDIYSLTKSSDFYTAKKIIRGVSSTEADVNGLYFTKGGAVYKYDAATGDSHLLFRSSNITVVSVYPVNGKLFMYGATKNSDGTLYAYKLNDSDFDGNKRIIDVLPISIESIGDLYADDFVGDKIFLQPYADGEMSDDDIKNEYINLVNKAGLTLDSKNIQVNR